MFDHWFPHLGHHLRALAESTVGGLTAFAIWFVGMLNSTPAVQWVGALVGVGHLGVLVSKEVRAWTRPGRD